MQTRHLNTTVTKMHVFSFADLIQGYNPRWSLPNQTAHHETYPKNRSRFCVSKNECKTIDP